MHGNHLAAFAMAGGDQIVTTDNAFKQFKGLNLKVLGTPLIDPRAAE